MNTRTVQYAVLAPALIAGMTMAIGIAQAGVVVDATRVVYASNQKEVSVSLHNTGDAPSLVQAWVDAGDPQTKPGEAKAPFALTPPLFRVDPTKGQTLRLIYTQERLATDRETVFWLNVLDIPPRARAAPDAPNRLEMAFRHRLKILFRPQGLPGRAADAARAVTWSIVRRDGKAALEARNPTPYFISYNGAEVTAGDGVATVRPDMVPPFATKQFPLSGPDLRTAGPTTVRYGFIDDYGAVIAGTASASIASD